MIPIAYAPRIDGDGGASCRAISGFRTRRRSSSPPPPAAPRGAAELALLALLLLGMATAARAQPWSGIVDPARAVDWSNTGITGGIPSRTTVCATLNPGATAAAIDAAITACPVGQVVFLNAGTYNLTAGINLRSNVTLRGDGADKTKLIFTGSTSCHSCCGGSSVCFLSGGFNWSGGPENSANWTAGYAKGTTQIILDNTTNLRAGNFIILDQLDDTADSGSIFNCQTAAPTGCTGEGGNGARTGRAQGQIVRVVAVNGNQVTIAPGLYMPNWRASQSPGAWWPTSPIKNAGLENLSVDNTNNTAAQDAIWMDNAMNCWVKGVRSVNANRNDVWLLIAYGNVVRDNYFYGGHGAASQSYGVEWYPGSDDLVENNIFQHVTAPLVQAGSMTGDVVSYNFAIDDNYTANGAAPSWMMQMFVSHGVGDAMILLEGNDGLGIQADNIHGTHHFTTLFRNHFYGDVFNNPPKSDNTTPMRFASYSRFFNVIGNVLGRTGYYNSYESNLVDNDTAIFAFGVPDNRRTASPDSRVATTLLRWGNYDTVTGAPRFLPGEAPTGLADYPNAVPGSQSLPPSFYLSARPAWWGTPWGTPAWPPIGPDVSGGDVPGFAGHAWKIPARLCYENTSVDSAYGSANVLAFNASNCYTGSTPAGAGSGGHLSGSCGCGTADPAGLSVLVALLAAPWARRRARP
jgi:hypothetical protein